MSALVQIQPNPNAGRKPHEHVLEFIGSAAGIFQSSRLAQRTIKLANEVRYEAGAGYSPVLSDLDSKFFYGWAMLGVYRLPAMYMNAVKTVKELQEPNVVPGELARKAVKTVNAVCEPIALTANVFGLLTKSRVLAPLAAVTDLMADAADLTLAADDFSKMSKMQKSVEVLDVKSDVRQNVEHSRKHAMIRIAKAVCSVVGGILGLLILALGGPIVPGIILVVIALASTIFAIYGHFYKETRPNKMIDAYAHPPLVAAT